MGRESDAMDSPTVTNWDGVIIGGGIIGLTLARAWLQREPGLKICILEKEANSTTHGTGRNSGVVHSGIYYGEHSLRARLCVAGAERMRSFAAEKGLWIDPCGKLLIPPTETALGSVTTLLDRGRTNGVEIECVDGQTMRELEPRANVQFDRALFIPTTAVVDPKAVAGAVLDDVKQLGATVCYGSEVLAVNAQNGEVNTSTETYSCGRIFNVAGLHADRVARRAGLQFRYSFQPFKGKYWKHRDPAFQMQRLVYPIPDLNLPFLGVHSAHNARGEVYFGPSSTPVIGRENYQGFDGIDWRDGVALSAALVWKLLRNTNGLRTLAMREAKLLRLEGVCAEISRLITGVQATDLQQSVAKVGIRSQIFDPKAQSLVNDFVVVEEARVVHVLNAISPAFTASFAFADYLLDQYR